MATRDETLRGMGRGLDILEKLATAIVEAGGREEDGLHFLTTPQAQAALAKMGGVVVDARNERDLKKVVVERRISIKQAIALGGYDEVDPRIEQLFQLPISDDVVRETVGIHPLCVYYQIPIGNAQSTRETLKKRGYRPASIGELLAFGAERHEHGLGLTFALGDVAGPPDTGLVCYIDSSFDNWDETKRHWVEKRCLCLVEGNLIVEKQHETANRDVGSMSNRHFILAVREQG